MHVISLDHFIEFFVLIIRIMDNNAIFSRSVTINHYIKNIPQETRKPALPY